MKLTVSSREVFKKKTKFLRKAGKVPGIIFGKHMDQSEPFTVSRVDFLKVFGKTGRSTPIEVVGDLDYLVLVSALQTDPVSDHLTHIDLLAVRKDEKVTAEVPVVLTGVSPYEKDGLGRVQVILNSIEVEAFPLDLPHNITIDISNLTEESQAVHLSDVDLWDKVEFVDELTRTILTTVAFVEEEEEEIIEPTLWEDGEPIETEGEDGVEGETAEGWDEK